ncbi:hypothetical protein QWY69_009065 [Klebsiella aerogenes]|uniref:hypothetical protein n=1 Tax=Klebsiella aerogenes TaxID=548 RepID=UPI0025B4F184|nr:hypothetical protein [Klebsiella aerogenes]EKM7809984.1 hypothetical protein [Klebsiella aerogenes]ELA0207100.1 hypothetical protein [Klebsiella aerogenes]ELA0228202.1 hypothetical protein [Klebsiella aerogenes]MDN3791625.1 hypothetical protein [Klebsiella aerogenes]HBR6953799.1 hypothetical protein [Klebsiella aerogenes]
MMPEITSCNVIPTPSEIKSDDLNTGLHSNDGSLSMQGAFTTIAAGDNNYVSPLMFGGIGNSPNTDNTKAVLAAVDAAVNLGLRLDLTGGPWRIIETIDLTNVKSIITDWTGRFLLDPSKFTCKHSAKYVITFGNPDTAFSDSRSVSACVIGLFAVIADGRGVELNGVFIKGHLLTFDSIRITNFNGSGLYAGAVWDSTVGSISVELCGNVANYALSIAPFGDTSNCLHIGRIQCEQAYHKQIYLNVIRSEIHTVHAERMYILTTDDGTTELPSGLNYENSYFLLSNSAVYQCIIDATSSSDIGTVTEIPSVRLNLYASKITAFSLVNCEVSSMYGNHSTVDNSVFYKYYNLAYPYKYTSCRFVSSSSDGLLTLGVGSVDNCEIDTFLPAYGTTSVLLMKSIINNNYNNTRTGVSGVLFDSCTFKKDVMQTGSTESNQPTKLRDCLVLGKLSGFYQQRLIVEGGYIQSVSLASRAYVTLDGVKGGSFSYSGDKAFVSRNCRFNSVLAWAVPTFGNYPAGERTQLLGAISPGDCVEYINIQDNGAVFKPLLYV